MDQYCADHRVFVVENMVNLDRVLAYGGQFLAHTYPMSFSDMTGLPCCLVATIQPGLSLEA